MTEAFDADWFDMRERFDHAARSLALAEQLAAMLPQRPRLLDIAPGTGGLCRFLAPIIGRAQVWTLFAADEAALGDAFDSMAGWAEARDWTVTWPGRALLVHSPWGAWRIEGRVGDLALPAALPMQTDAVVSSGPVPMAWIARFAATMRCPFLAGLVSDGRAAWMPRHPADAVVGSGLRRLGHAPVAPAFASRGCGLRTAPSDWRVPRSASRMAAEIVTAAAAAARAALPSRRASIVEWEHARLLQARRGGLAIAIGHRDILALPP